MNTATSTSTSMNNAENIERPPRNISLSLLLRGYACRSDAAVAYLMLLFVSCWLATCLWMCVSSVPLNPWLASAFAKDTARGEIVYVDARWGKRNLPQWQYLVKLDGSGAGASKLLLVEDKPGIGKPGDHVTVRLVPFNHEIGTITGATPVILPGLMILFLFVGVGLSLWSLILGSILHSLRGSVDRIRALKYGEAVSANAAGATQVAGEYKKTVLAYKRKYKFQLESGTHEVEALANHPSDLPETTLAFVRRSDPTHAITLASLSSLGKVRLRNGHLETEPIGLDIALGLPAVAAVVVNLAIPFAILYASPIHDKKHVEQAWKDPSLRTAFASEMLSGAKENTGAADDSKDP